jgi:hypothetical protein
MNWRSPTRKPSDSKRHALMEVSMRSMQVLVVLGMAVLSCASFGADDQKPSRPSSYEASQLSPPAVISSDSDSALSSELTDFRESNSEIVRWDRKASWHLPLSPARDVCYTMRTYKVKAIERLSDNENGSRGFSTCQFARDYQFRSADIRLKSPGSADSK